jgi:ferritin-like protein
MDKQKVLDIISKYQATGRVAWYYPSKKRITLNGFPSLPEKEAIKRMLEVIKKENK